MNRFLVVLGLLIVTSGCAANPPLVMRSTDIICVDAATLAKTLDNYGEKPAITMSTNREIAGKTEPLATVLFINYTTKTWTMAERVNDDLFCVIGVGNHVQPYLPKDFF